MRRLNGAIAGLVAAVGACSNSDDGAASPCADVSGNWEVTSVRLSGTCDPKLDGDGKSTMTLARDASGGYSMVIAGVEGACPTLLDVASCKLTSSCEVKSKDGALLATSSAEYTISNNTLTGTSIGAVKPPIVEKACTANYRETGKKL